MKKDINYNFGKLKFGSNDFMDLMQKKTHNILLVSTFYDAFIFEEDGLFSEQVFSEYDQLFFSQIPRITNVPTGKEALKIIKERDFDLVITMLRIGEVTPYKLAEDIKREKPELPVLLLLNNESDIEIINRDSKKMEFIDDVFLWSGDNHIFLAMIKYIEDLQNVETDTESGLVHVILLVEDSVRYYSRFLPLLYREIMQQSQRLISAELTPLNRRRRMRTRPKVLLVHNYNDAVQVIERFKESLICVISDVKYPKDGILEGEAGLKLMRKINHDEISIAKLLQSTNADNAVFAKDVEAEFLLKNSETLLKNLRKFILNNLGFGDLILRNKEGNEIARASNMLEFENLISKVPVDSILYHGGRNHFSSWLIAHGEIQIARRIRPIKIDNFPDPESLRSYLKTIFEEIRLRKNRGRVIEFDKDNIDPEGQIIRLREGSLGGKGRGLAFLNSLINSLDIDSDYKDIKIKMPKTFIIGTDEFDDFISNNNIKEAILELSNNKNDIIKNWNEYDDVVSLLQKITAKDEEIEEIFLKGDLSKILKRKLEILLDVNTNPIAVRSSGLLEDSQSQPFAGIYSTYMFPNNDADIKVRLKNLTSAIKLVFASVFLKNARDYIRNINYKLEEEKMAVIIQNIVGSEFDVLFYPHISGVAQSYNFYPTSKLKNSDGIATIGVGMGKSVVDGESNFIFCPKYPKHGITSNDDVIKNTQKTIYAVDMNSDCKELNRKLDGLQNIKIRKIKHNGSFEHLASIWDYENDKLQAGVNGKGPVIIDFANIIKYRYIPLPDVLNNILNICKKAMGVPVEIEFAVKMNEKNKEHTFYLLQIRPLNVHMEAANIDKEHLNKDELLLYSESGMGNGTFDSIKDIIVFDPAKFDNTRTVEMQEEIEQFNLKLKGEERKYLLIGPGRWGTRDRFLGIPVKWSQISNAKAIIEVGLKDFQVDASQGTHFFHNLMSMNVGYFSIPFSAGNDFLDIDWILQQYEAERKEFFIHYSFDKPLVMKIDGKQQLAIIFKPQIDTN
ncbi:MAG: PEP/pyruvate-binding domain-containing protein [Candidatus Cloacimonadota bacterium]|nr:PEP/pyruvate-binding domain-containing protein [Candidatus Cloacimonadota bacterium]